MRRKIPDSLITVEVEFGTSAAIAVGGGVVMLNALRLIRRVSVYRTQPEAAGD
jgi:hypothetical protein